MCNPNRPGLIENPKIDNMVPCGITFQPEIFHCKYLLYIYFYAYNLFKDELPLIAFSVSVCICVTACAVLKMCLYRRQRTSRSLAQFQFNRTTSFLGPRHQQNVAAANLNYENVFQQSNTLNYDDLPTYEEATKKEIPNSE